MAECWSAGWDVCLSSEHQTRSCLPVDFISSILLDYIPHIPTKHSTLNLPRVGCCMHTKITGKVSSTFLTETFLWADRQTDVTQLPKHTGNLGRMAYRYLKFMACVGSLTLFVLFFSFFKIMIFVCFCFLDKSMFFFRTREKFMAACRCC